MNLASTFLFHLVLPQLYPDRTDVFELQRAALSGYAAIAPSETKCAIAHLFYQYAALCTNVHKALSCSLVEGRLRAVFGPLISILNVRFQPQLSQFSLRVTIRSP